MTKQEYKQEAEFLHSIWIEMQDMSFPLAGVVDSRSKDDLLVKGAIIESFIRRWGDLMGMVNRRQSDMDTKASSGD